MRSTVIGFAAGVGYLQTQAQLPSVLVLLMLTGAAVLAGAATGRLQPKSRLLCRAGVGAALGFVWAALFAHHYLGQELSRQLEGEDIVLVGTVDSLPQHFSQGVRFDFAVEQAPAGMVVPDRMALAWYYTFEGGEAGVQSLPRPGERWQLNVRLRRPHGNANPHGFDYEVWLLERKLRATGTVRPARNADTGNRRLDSFVPGWRAVIERSRGGLRDRIDAALAGKDYAGVVTALVIGDQRAISQSDWEVFNRTGVSHLVSISGLHITMVAGMVAAIVNFLWRRSFFTRGALPLLLPAQKAAALAGAVAAVIYVALAGFGVPAQRTLYMLIVVAAALWSGRIASISHVLCAALVAVLLLDPWAVLWPGFWLSFSAVAIILYVTTGRVQRGAGAQHPTGARMRQALREAVHVQLAITIGLVPLTLLLFGQISLVSPLANAIAIPVISFLVTPLSLAGSVLPDPLSVALLGLAHMMIEWLAAVLDWLSSFPLAVWRAPVPPPWIFVLALAGTAWLLAPRGWPVRWLGAVAWVPVLLNTAAQPQRGQIWLTAFDVGQGMALLVETNGRRLLYDTGPYYSPEADGASRVIIPYLRGRGIDALDAVVISHNDIDHSGGALSLFREIAVGHVWSSMALDSAVVQAAAHHTRCQAGQSWTWNEVQFEMLHPAAASYDDASWKPNARSCTLKITLGRHAILLPGDIERAQESALVEAHAKKLQASILLAPHHGSGTSSTMPFLQAVRPEIALFQVGYRNRYRHPKQEVFERYGSLGIRRLRTDESGAIRLSIGAQIAVSEYRTEHARYWHRR